MTACIYFSPPATPGDPTSLVLAVLMADALATFIDRPVDSVAITPATLSTDLLHRTSSVILVRKLQIINNTAVAMAGNGDFIIQFLRELTIQLPELSLMDRPMRRVGQIADKCGVKTIGVHVDGNGLINSVGPGGWSMDLPHLGKVYAIGSGRQDLAEKILHVEKTIVNDNTPWTPFERALLFYCCVNARQITRSTFRRKEENWGGIYEGAYYDGALGKWTRMAASIYFIFEVICLPNNRAALRMHPRVVAYDPGPTIGKVLTIFSDAGGSRAIEFPLQDHLNEKYGPMREANPVFWQAWRPICATITFVFPNRKDHSDLSYMMLGEKLDKILIEFDGKTISASVEGGFIIETAGTLIEIYGYTIVPSSRFTDEEKVWLASNPNG